MKIALFGGSGRTGRAIIEAAIGGPHEVVAHARDASKLADYAGHVTCIEGPLDDSRVIDRTLAGCDASISALGTVIRKPNTVLSDITADILAGLERAQIGRFVCVSSLGVGDSLPQVKGWVMRTLIKTFGKNIWADKDRQEQLIRSSICDYLIVRPGGLQDKPATGRIIDLPASAPNPGGSQMIPRDDVARYCLTQATIPTLHRKTVTLLSGSA